MLLISILQTLDYPEICVSFKPPQLDQLDLCLIAARSSTDQIGLRSDITRVKVGKIGYISGTDLVNNFNPTKLDRYTNVSPSTRYLTWQIHDRSSNSFRWDWLLDPTRLFLTCQKLSHREPEWCRPRKTFQPIPITQIDRARPIPECLIELNRVDRIDSGNLAVGSQIDADQERPSRPIPITQIDRARPIPDCVIELIESAVGT